MLMPTQLFLWVLGWPGLAKSGLYHGGEIRPLLKRKARISRTDKRKPGAQHAQRPEWPETTAPFAVGHTNWQHPAKPGLPPGAPTTNRRAETPLGWWCSVSATTRSKPRRTHWRANWGHEFNRWASGDSVFPVSTMVISINQSPSSLSKRPPTAAIVKVLISTGVRWGKPNPCETATASST